MSELKVLSGSISSLMEEIDDWCGTGRHPGFPPHRLGLEDLLISVVIGDLAARLTDTQARSQLTRAAEDLYAGAAKKVAAGTMAAVG